MLQERIEKREVDGPPPPLSQIRAKYKGFHRNVREAITTVFARRPSLTVALNCLETQEKTKIAFVSVADLYEWSQEHSLLELLKACDSCWRGSRNSCAGAFTNSFVWCRCRSPSACKNSKRRIGWSSCPAAR